AARCDFEDRAQAVAAAEVRRSVKVAIATLNQPGVGYLAVAAALGEAVQDGLGATRCDLEDRAVVARSACPGRSVVIAVDAQDQTGIGVAAARGEGVQHGLRSARRDLEDRTAAARAARGSRAVHIAVAALDQTGIGDAGEGVKNGLGPTWRDLEDS